MHIRRLTRSLLAKAAVLLLLAPLAPAALLAAAPPAAALDNGLATTPPLGFNDWNAYGCNVSEALIKATADAMHSNGMQAAGYQYVNIDDCWMTSNRDAAGHLVPDPAKFPDGISGTAAYVHGLGLKLGIYEDAGTATCAGYPGSLGHETQDAASFAAWGVDYLKYDNCSNQGISATTRYTAMRDALRATGRPILFSLCNWGQESVWTWGAPVGNSWRTTNDINASYGSMLGIFHANVGLGAFAGPGHWNDPDMLEVGNGMSATEDRSEFTLWSEMSAPLIAGTNVAAASADTLATLTNRQVLAVDQDPLGRQGQLVAAGGGLDVLAKPLAGGDVAVVLFNENSAAATISTSTGAIGKAAAGTYTLTDLWSGASSTTGGPISATVPGHGTVMYRVSGGGAPAVPSGVVSATGAGKCLDVPWAGTTPGTQLEIWDCNGGGNQVWTRTPSGQLTVYTGGDTRCLDAYDNQTTPGTKVEIWSCNGGANQQWRFNPDGTVTGVQSGLCLDVTGGSVTDGALAQLWTCAGGSNQQWRLS
ncbi:glycoside hydrolase family 27 protein [Kitasatospora viridis]|uniref:Alpha-galactosidase n=1 Tax=Kitasatospora viridis TaxID=281105 RepID=A0A561UBP1_9ACTN|nr:alpha-galactosidase [Kitasatospora viridis]TWF96775.1 alpha-galactosidase [Kitasatospora viridis]